MKSKLASILLSRRFYFSLFLLSALAFQIGTSAQSLDPTLSVAFDPKPILCPELAMCIMDPDGHGCMGTPCVYPVPTPTPVVCVTGPCLPVVQVPTTVCLPLEPIDPCIPLTGQACLAENMPCVTAPPPPAPSYAPLVISEFRFRGLGGANDEFIELFNTAPWAITVFTSDGSPGWALVASDGVVRFVIPNGTVIPPYGHYLAVNSVGYSLSDYPAGSSTTATGDIAYVLDIPDRAGIALFSTSEPINFVMATRVDAVGYNTVPALYREGVGFQGGAGESLFNIQYSFYRDLSSGMYRDGNDNVTDFRGVDTNGTNTGAGQFLGAPGPSNLSSPVLGGSSRMRVDLLDPAVGRDVAPNRVRDGAANPENNSAWGTMSVRRTLVNTSGEPITRLRVRVVDITGYPYMSGTSDIRVISSSDTVVTRSDGTNVFVNGTTLETPPVQINGGGWNSTLSIDDVTPSSPLYPNQSISVQFMLGVQQQGNFRFFIVIEAL